MYSANTAVDMEEGTVLHIQAHFPVLFNFVCNGPALRVSVRSQTKYPSLRSSGVTAALLTPSPGLGPPPRLDTEWMVRQSLEEGVLEGRAPDRVETAEALDAWVCPLGSMTVLMTK